MNYVLTSDFLFTSNLCTSINFLVSDKVSVYDDLNKRIKIVKYISGMKYSDLSRYIPDLMSYTDSLVTPNLFHLRENTSTVINNVKYYVNNCIDMISCFICSGINELLVSNRTLHIITDGTLKSYKNLLNNSDILRTENLDSLNIVSNFECINLNLPFNGKFNSRYVHVYDEFSINDSMIVSAFVDALNDYLPDYTIAPELNKEFIKKQKQKILIYEAKLTEHGGDFSTHVRSRPDLGRYAQTETEVSIELLSDDFETYMHTRDLLLMNKHLFHLTTYNLTDKYGREWSYSCNWTQNELASEIDRSPKSKYFDETILYSIQLNVRLVGWLVENFNINAARIADPLVLRYTQDIQKNRLINKEFDIAGDQLSINLSVGSIIDLSNTEIFYTINNVKYRGSIDRNTNQFEIVIDTGVKYTGEIDTLSGEFIFNKRYSDLMYLLDEYGDKILDQSGVPIIVNTSDCLLMDKGKVSIMTKQAVEWLTEYHIVAEIIPDNNTYLITELNEYITTQDGRKIIVGCSLDYMNTEFRYVYYGYCNGYHIFSINPDLLDKIKLEFNNIYSENQPVIIVSSHNEVHGYKSDSDKLSGSIIWSSGNSKIVANYLDYNLYNYNGKFIKIKELKQ